MKKQITVLLCIILFVVGCGGRAEQEEIVELNILAAASMADVLENVAEMYREEEPNVVLTFHFDSSGTLKTQIEQGAPADVFLSASMKQMNELNEAGLMKEDSILKLLENEVVLIKPMDSKLDIASFEEVAADKVSMVAIGNADVPVGQYTEEIYRNLGLWESVYQKANLATNVRQVLEWVAAGNADCGIVYRTDAMIEEGVDVVCGVPEGSCEKVIYPVGVIKAGSHIEEAEKFLLYLKTEKVRAVFEKYGFTNYEE